MVCPILCGVIDPEILNEAGMDEADAPFGRPLPHQEKPFPPQL